VSSLTEAGPRRHYLLLLSGLFGRLLCSLLGGSLLSSFLLGHDSSPKNKKRHEFCLTGTRQTTFVLTSTKSRCAPRRHVPRVAFPTPWIEHPQSKSECDSLLLKFPFDFFGLRKTACKECNRFSTNVVLSHKLVKSILFVARHFFQNRDRA
jgi:hypothetical protein